MGGVTAGGASALPGRLFTFGGVSWLFGSLFVVLVAVGRLVCVSAVVLAGVGVRVRRVGMWLWWLCRRGCVLWWVIGGVGVHRGLCLALKKAY